MEPKPLDPNMKLRKLPLLSSIFLISAIACSNPDQVDSILHNGKVYTVDAQNSQQQAVAIKDGKIVAVGTNDDILKKFAAKDIYNLEGKAVYPGFIDGHGHFVSYGLSQQQVDLVGAKSWEEIVERVKTFASQNDNEWIVGRGWDQNLWENKDFPTNDLLNQAFPDKPVLLVRVDGHAAIVNKKAFDIAGIKKSYSVVGGEFITQNNQLTGVLIDNAIDEVSKMVPATSKDDIIKAVNIAQKNGFEQGLTTIVDCGTSSSNVDIFSELSDKGYLKMGLYAMLADSKSNLEYLLNKGIIKKDRLHVRGMKVMGDGALGSRGACLIHDYSDQANWKGFLLNSLGHYDSLANVLVSNGFQMNTHAIGDSTNRAILNIYAKYLKPDNDLRWRIEHAQVIHPDDFKYFGKYSIIPSIQPTHATSDWSWAGARLGAEREKGAYAFKDLLKQVGWVTLGTDFPVEDISPFKTFYASVVRKDMNGLPENGYQMENALSREATLKGMTIWGAKAIFEENERGSIEVGKEADIIVLDQDLMEVEESKILNTKVILTFKKGELVHSKL